MDDLGKWQASAIIDQLQEFKDELPGDKPLDTSRITDDDDAASATRMPPPLPKPVTYWWQNPWLVTLVFLGFLGVLALAGVFSGG